MESIIIFSSININDIYPVIGDTYGFNLLESCENYLNKHIVEYAKQGAQVVSDGYHGTFKQVLLSLTDGSEQILRCTLTKTY